MPPWAEVIIGISVLIGAISVIWAKVLKPGARLIAQLEKTYPLLVTLTDVFEGGANFSVLDEIADQFKSDSGSTLKDAMNRLELTVSEAKAIADGLRLSSEVSKALAEQDRDQLRRVELLVARLTDHVTDIAAADAIAKEKVEGVAAALAASERKVEGVAADLAAGRDRADQVPPSSNPGEAADAASRNPAGEIDEP